MPARSIAAERSTLEVHGRAAQHKSSPPTEGELSVVRKRTLELYPRDYDYPKWYTKALKDPRGFTPETLMDTINFDQLFNEVIMADASPGYPYMLIASTNEKLLKHEHSRTIKNLVVDRIFKLATEDLRSPLENIRNNLVDPVKIFIKGEPHTHEKVARGKIRIISSVSLVDQLVERLLHSEINATEIAMWENIPSMPGIGLTTDEDFAKIAKIIKENPSPLMTDLSSWDWSVKHWMLMNEALTRVEMFEEEDSMYRKMILARAHLTSYSVYLTSDGNCYMTPYGGVQLSGSYLTSSGNSRMRIQLSLLAGPYDGAVAMGDDCVDSHSIKEVCDKYGLTLKFETPFTDSIDFCSHTIELDEDRNYKTHYPNNPGKSLCNLVTAKITPDKSKHVQQLLQFVDFIRHHPQRDEMLRALNDYSEYYSSLMSEFDIRF
nr:RNA-dependent RNA polymerase [Sobelivirales sp.]